MFPILLAAVIVSGLSQELLLPLLTIWLEQRGAPAELNAMNAAALYVGVFGTMFVVLVALLRLRNRRPDAAQNEPSNGKRYGAVYRLAWFPLLPSFLYGYMEASMNANFPVYGLRAGLSAGDISLLLPWFGIGSLVLQLPLGLLSDRTGRKPVLVGAGIVGTAAFLAVPLAGTNVWLIGALFAVAGGAVGSFYSLGLAYAADLLSKPMLPAVGVLASIHYSAASLIGPNVGCWTLQRVSLQAPSLILGAAYLLFVLLTKSSHPNEG